MIKTHESANLSSLTQQIWTSVDGDEIDIAGVQISVFGIFQVCNRSARSWRSHSSVEIQWSRKHSRVAGATDTGCGCGFDY